MKTELDFLIVGAQKAGTTSLFEYLRRHPEIYMPPAKEAPYFSHDKVMRRGWDAYLSQTFAYADPSKAWGTATPHYMAGSVYEADSDPSGPTELILPERIHAQLPKVRLIAILRDPVERAISHHRMMRLRGDESRLFDEAIDDLLQPGALRRARSRPSPTSAYVVWGEYGRILAGYRSFFGPDQLKVVFTHDLEDDPAEVLGDLHRYLGVHADFLPDNLDKRYRVGAAGPRVAGISPSAVRAWSRRNRTFRRLWNGLPTRVRHSAYQAYDWSTYRFDLWNRRQGTDDGRPSLESERRLRAHFESEDAELRSLINIMPPWSRDASSSGAG